MKKILTLILLLITSNAYADYYYLGQWDWVTDDIGSHWEQPEKEYLTGTIDLRSLPQMSENGGVAQGFAIFSYSQSVSAPGLIYIGNDTNGVVNNAMKAQLKNKLGFSGNLENSTIKDIIYELLAIKGDPTGQTRWKPLMPDRNMNMKVYLGSEGIIKQSKLDPLISEEWKFVVAVHHENYKQKLKDGESRELIAKNLDYLEHRYGVHYSTFIPDGYERMQSIQHATTLTDDFNRANESLPANNWSEVNGSWEIVSNALTQAGSTSGERLARYDQDVSGDDHYTLITYVSTANSFAYCGAAARFSASAETFYGGRIRQQNSDRVLMKNVSGTETTLNSDTGGSAPPHDVKVEVDGSTIKLIIDDTEVFSETDSAITGNTRGGATAHTNQESVCDDFEISDLATGKTIKLKGKFNLKGNFNL